MRGYKDLGRNVAREKGRFFAGLFFRMTTTDQRFDKTVP